MGLKKRANLQERVVVSLTGFTKVQTTWRKPSGRKAFIISPWF